MNYKEVLDKALMEKTFQRNLKNKSDEDLLLDFYVKVMTFLDVAFYAHDKGIKDEKGHRVLYEYENKNSLMRDFERNNYEKLQLTLPSYEFSIIHLYPDFNSQKIQVKTTNWMDEEKVYSFEKFMDSFVKSISENFV